MQRNLPLTLRLEIERVNLLYRLNFSGVFALLLYAGAHAYVCGTVMSLYMLAGWIGLVIVTAVLRLIASWRWRKVRDSISSEKQVHRWHLYLQVLLGLSGLAWGIAGWMSQYSQNAIQQMFTAMTLTFMAAGALLCWAVSIPAMLLVVLPSVVPWAVGFFMSQNSELTFMGILALVYLALGIAVAVVINRLIMKSLKLSIDNENLKSPSPDARV
jgi:hypothetical protein